jgi:hypothetical protein
VNGIFHVKDFGAYGVAVPIDRLKLAVFQHVDCLYPPTERIIYGRDPKAAEDDSAGIQRAIDEAHRSGGGRVLVPAGDYLIAPLRLRSRVELHLLPGSRLWGSTRLQDYLAPAAGTVTSITDAGYGCSEHRVAADLGFRRLICAADEHDVAVTGSGQISGQSGYWFIPWLNRERQPVPFDRPKETVLFKRCASVRVEGIRIVDPPYWTLVFDECDGVGVRGVTVKVLDGPNADGIDVCSCCDVTISDCRLHVFDDAICLKNATLDRTTSRVTITNCIIRTVCNGFKIGTDSLGGFEDIVVSNLVIRNQDNDMNHACGGINVNCVDGGWVRNVSIQNIIMGNVRCPIYMVLGCRSRQQSRHRKPRAGKMENISIANLTAEGSKHPCFVVGQWGSPVLQVRLDNIRIHKTGGTCKSPTTDPVPERPESYPDPWMFGSFEQGDELPAYGLYLRHVEGLMLRDFHTVSAAAEVRPQFVAEHVTLCSPYDAAGPIKQPAGRVHVAESLSQ